MAARKTDKVIVGNKIKATKIGVTYEFLMSIPKDKKICSSCKEVKEVIEFSFIIKTDKYSSHCKSCQSAYRNTEQRKEYMRLTKSKYKYDYRLQKALIRSRPKYKARRKELDSTPEGKARNVANAARHRLTVAYKISREKYLNNSKVKTKIKAYRRSEPVTAWFKISKMKRRMKVDGQDCINQEEWVFALSYFKYKCAVCNLDFNITSDRTVAADHWIALSRGGSNSKNNIIPLCHGKGGCNNKKGNSIASEWLEKKYGTVIKDTIVKKITNYFTSINERTSQTGA